MEEAAVRDELNAGKLSIHTLCRARGEEFFAFSQIQVISGFPVYQGLSHSALDTHCEEII